MRTEVLGVGFDPVTPDEAVGRVLALAEERRGAYVCTPNPEIVMLCRQNAALAEAVNGADLVCADGIGVVWAAKTLGRPLPARVAGFDLFTAVLERLRGGVFLYGGTPGTAEAAAEEIRRRYPGVTVCGTADGYEADDADVVRRIEATGPAVTAVCLGSPKQELWMAAHRGLTTGVMLGLGGTLDVLAGKTVRAPARWRERGLEWLWRLLREPKRIKRQMCLPAFLLAVRRQRIREWKKED